MSDRDPQTDAANGSKESLRASAQRKFMDALIKRQFRPGHLVSQREIAQVTGSSLPSVRDALKLLEVEGIVTLIPKRGVTIRELSRQEIKNTYQLRILIELEALNTYVHAVDLDKIAHFKSETERLINAQPATLEEENNLFQQRIELDHHLHRDIVFALNNDLISTVHRNTETSMLLARMILPPNLHAKGRALQEHLELLEAIEKRDLPTAIQMLRTHLECACERAVESATL